MSRSSATSFEHYALEMRSQIEEALLRYCQTEPGCPEQLGEAMRYSLLAPAKRLRPLLVLMAAEACGGTVEAALPAACAVEMIHSYSLIHDDLPAMDDDDLRRGLPTNHKVFGEATAILAGDALLTRAFEVLANEIRPAETALACCSALGQAAGATALVGGQADDLSHERDAEERAAYGESKAALLGELESIHARKTGALFLVSLRMGALTAGAGAEPLKMLEEYGRALGLAFQIADDLLDVGGNEQAVGKRVGKDANRGKLTFPGLMGVEESRRRAERLIAEACDALAPLGPPAERLVMLARYVVERDR
ncbi:MAG TPA: farnesyl diphosphate synthase [Pirellulales bacterium]|nr:farnesyl diphosphate synthase [Pirellulales bacterium]